MTSSTPRTFQSTSFIIHLFISYICTIILSPWFDQGRTCSNLWWVRCGCTLNQFSYVFNPQLFLVFNQLGYFYFNNGMLRNEFSLVCQLQKMGWIEMSELVGHCQSVWFEKHVRRKNHLNHQVFITQKMVDMLKQVHRLEDLWRYFLKVNEQIGVGFLTNGKVSVSRTWENQQEAVTISW